MSERIHVEFADQYGKCCLVLTGNEDPDLAIDQAYEDEAIFNDGEDDLVVVRFPGRPQEVYTQDALRRSLKTRQP